MIDYAAGDVVVCVDATPDKLDPLAHLLEVGHYYRAAVIGVRSDGVLAVGFRSLPDLDYPGKAYAFRVSRFRKLPRAEEEFTAYMRQMKPAKVDA